MPELRVLVLVGTQTGKKSVLKRAMEKQSRKEGQRAGRDRVEGPHLSTGPTENMSFEGDLGGDKNLL